MIKTNGTENIHPSKSKLQSLTKETKKLTHRVMAPKNGSRSAPLYPGSLGTCSVRWADEFCSALLAPAPHNSTLPPLLSSYDLYTDNNMLDQVTQVTEKDVGIHKVGILQKPLVLYSTSFSELKAI